MTDVFLLTAAVLIVVVATLQRERAVMQSALAAATRRVALCDEAQTAADSWRDRAQALERQIIAFGGTPDGTILPHTGATAAKTLAEQLERVKSENTQLSQALDSARAEALALANDRSAREDTEGRIRQELIGLRGKMERVAFIFDRSGSMMEGGRWQQAVHVAQAWMQLLAVKNAALIIFNQDVEVIPDSRALVPFGQAARQTFVDRLYSTVPDGGTNTLAALQEAYRLDVDTIILFTDGNPGVVKNGESVYLSNEVLALVDRETAVRGQTIPINTIGLGDYCEQDFRNFLRSIAEKSGGAFLVR